MTSSLPAPSLMHRIILLPSWLRLPLGLVPAGVVCLTVPAAWQPLTRITAS